MEIKILHTRQVIGETIAWALRFGSLFNASYIHDLKEINAKSTEPLIILTDFTHFDQLLKMDRLSQCPIILMIDDIENSLAVEALLAGAAAVIDISKEPEQMIERVHQVLLQKDDDRNILIHKLLDKSIHDKEPRDEKDYDLTSKEKQILKLMREGVHLKLIARNTGTAYETVRTHVKRIYKKIGVMSASEAVIKAMKMDL